MESPKLALIPSGYNSGTVYSILPTDGVGDFDFSRNAPATRVKSDGLIEAVTNNVPRLDYSNSDCPSLLLEPLRTNLQIKSEEFNNGEWSKIRGIITENNTISPNGKLTADKITGDGTGTTYVYDGISLINGVTYSISIFVKQIVDISSFSINVFGGVGTAAFDLFNKTVNSTTGDFTSAKIENYGNGWLRCSAVMTLSSSTGVKNIGYGLFDFNGDQFYLFGAQVEEGSYSTSYIKTTSGIVTRQKDICNNAGDSQLLNNPENTFFIDLNKIYKTGTADSRISLNDGSATNRVLFSTQTNNITIILYSIRNSVTTTVKYFSVDYDARNKIAYTLKANEIKFYVNGAKIHEALFLPIPLNLSNISFDENNGGSRVFQGEVNEVRYYDRVLTEAEAIELTTI